MGERGRNGGSVGREGWRGGRGRSADPGLTLTVAGSDFGGDSLGAEEHSHTLRCLFGRLRTRIRLCEQGRRNTNENCQVVARRRPHPYYCSSSTRSPPQQQWAFNPRTEVPGSSPPAPAPSSTLPGLSLSGDSAASNSISSLPGPRATSSCGY